MYQQPQDINPICRMGGKRNLQCPYYLFCLDIAAANLWPDFTCDLCFYRKVKEIHRIEELDLCSQGWEDIWGGGSL